ncbi:MAG: hypothetical protein KGH59_03620 [Candidatus Micrarchaeota archaeon]|nr:hypothetical protein [Candidatus Micrarchaeota archaeon]MDE1804845.1 hypothetical protein [Candidatus Micrarchaeota archaeon]
METDYTTIAQALDGIAQGEAQKILIVDANQALSEQVKISEYNYDAACRQIGTIETTLTVEQQAAQQKPQIVPSMNVTQRATQIRQRIGEAEIQKKMVVEGKEVLDAAKEVGRLVGGASRGFEQMMEERISKMQTKKLVLPNLSVQDQMHELEGILEALDQNALDAEQLKIVKLEVAGVNVSRQREKPQDDSQRALIASRDKLLSDIGNRLLNTNN